MKIGMDIDLDEKLLRGIETMHLQLQKTSMPPVLKALAEPIQDRAKQIAPSSIKTGTRKLWGSNVTATFNPNTMRKHSSGRYISYKNLLKSDIGPMVIIGPKYPEGNKQNFNNSPDGRVVYYWGRRDKNGKIRQGDDPRFIDKARDEMLSIAITNFTSELERQLEQLFERM